MLRREKKTSSIDQSGPLVKEELIDRGYLRQEPQLGKEK